MVRSDSIPFSPPRVPFFLLCFSPDWSDTLTSFQLQFKQAAGAAGRRLARTIYGHLVKRTDRGSNRSEIINRGTVGRSVIERSAKWLPDRIECGPGNQIGRGGCCRPHIASKSGRRALIHERAPRARYLARPEHRKPLPAAPREPTTTPFLFRRPGATRHR